jgi:hypothetical protein
LLNPVEQAVILEEWMSRTRVYRMSGNFGNVPFAQQHSSALEKLEALTTFRTSKKGGRSPRMLFGLFSPEQKVLAVVGTEASQKSGLVCLALSVRPSQLGNKESKIKQWMLSGLHVLADRMDMQLDMTSVFGCW